MLGGGLRNRAVSADPAVVDRVINPGWSKKGAIEKSGTMVDFGPERPLRADTVLWQTKAK